MEESSTSVQVVCLSDILEHSLTETAYRALRQSHKESSSIMTGIIARIVSLFTQKKPNTSTQDAPDFQDEKLADLLNGKFPDLTIEQAAHKIVHVLFGADDHDFDYTAEIDDVAHQAGGWSVWLASEVRAVIGRELVSRRVFGCVLASAYDEAHERATVFEEFSVGQTCAPDIFEALHTVGVLVILAPWVVELLGFAEHGIVKGNLLITSYRKTVSEDTDTDVDLGSWASSWYTTYREFLPSEFLFFYLWKLGMEWDQKSAL